MTAGDPTVAAGPPGSGALDHRAALSARQAAAGLGTVFWRPFQTLKQPYPTSAIAILLLVILAIDFILSLLLVPTFLDAIRQAAGEQPVSASGKVSALGVAVIISSSLNGIIISLMAALFWMLFWICNQKAEYGNILKILLLASSPLILDRIIRFVAALLVPGQKATDSLLPLSLVFPARSGTDAGKLLDYFGLFDIWTFLLVAVGMVTASQVKKPVSLVGAILLWGGLQALLARLHLAGFGG